MSLARWALRTAAVEALRGATLVGDNVRDSDFSALTIEADGSARTSEDRPFILVYTDDGTANDADLRDLRQNGTVDFVCEFGIASPMIEADDHTGESYIAGINIPMTDSAMELALDLVDRQITARLVANAPWADLWRSLSDSTVKIERRRTSSADGGVRLAARQLRLTLDVKPDPVVGQPLAETSVWARFAALIAADRPGYSATVSAFLGTEEDALTFDQINASRGLTDAEGRALNTGPQYPTLPDAIIEEMPIEAEVNDADDAD